MEENQAEPPKTAKQLEKEAKKQAKLEKFKLKQQNVETKPKPAAEVCFVTVFTVCVHVDDGR